MDLNREGNFQIFSLRFPLKQEAPGLSLLIILFFVIAPSASAIDFTYSGPDCQIIYRFTPLTGTLNDLKIIYDGNFSFYPSYHGGIISFSLGGERLHPWEGKHRCEIIGETANSGVYAARFRWSHNGESFEFTMEIKLTGKTLTVSYAADPLSQNVLEFGFDRSEGTPDPKVIALPYGHPVLCTNKIFISGVLDFRLSNASSVSFFNSRYSDTSAYYSQIASYGLRTDGKRNPLKETLYLAVSPRIEETFCAFPNPVSPYRSFLADKVIVDLWRQSFRDCKNDIQTLSALGMTELFVLVHVWQKYGYDNGFPTTYPAGDMYGGDAGLKEVANLCLKNNYLFALHTNYVDFYPNSDVWNPNDVALSSLGMVIKAWYNPWTGLQSFLMKPSRCLSYAQIYEPLIHNVYSTTAAYLDVHSAVLPSFKVDYDAGVEDAGKQSLTYRSYCDLFSYVRDVHQGPLAGEGFGYSASIWAGHIDAIEADPRSLFDLQDGKWGSEVPTVVDYKLRILNPLFVPHGAGYLSRFFPEDRFSYNTEELERYRGTELVFGSAGFLNNPFNLNIPQVEILRDYCFLKYLQKHYLNSSPKDIFYSIEGALFSLSDSLNILLPKIPWEKVDKTLLEELSLIKVVHEDGFTLYVNRSSSKFWEIYEGGVLYVLPPSGFLAFKGKEFLAHTAIVNGVKSYYLWPAENICRGHLTDYIYPPLNCTGKRVVNRSLFQVEHINIISWRPNPANYKIAGYRIYLGEGNRRQFLAEVDDGTFSYWHRKVSRDVSCTYAIVALNEEGREGEASFITIAGQ